MPRLYVLFLAFALAFFAPAAKAQSTVELNSQTHDAILDALDEERHAEAIYQAVINLYGQVRPFSQIVVSERQHQAALLTLCERYGIDVPPNPWKPEEITLPTTFSKVCALGVSVEIEDVALYDKFFTFVKEPDVVWVFSNLRDASLYNHLPAFQRCTKRTIP